MAGFNLVKLSMLLTLLSDLKLGSWREQKEDVAVGEFPARCYQIDCPTYEVVNSGNGYEIRKYDSANWATTSVIDADSFNEGTFTGFTRLFEYFRGFNQFNVRMDMTAPMITEIAPSNGKSSFLVSLYLPKRNQELPPPGIDNITVKKWEETFVAVRQFSGLVNDSVIDVESKALTASLSGTIWGEAVKKSHGGEITKGYTVAQYGEYPYKQDNRVNEIWFKFEF